MIFRRYIAKTIHFSPLWKPYQIFNFSQQASNAGSNKIEIEDWEYCRSIGMELKQNKVNEALSYLFQSYLNGRILDIQIYNSIFQKINELKLQLSYSQILYQIYRQHFPPHVLMSKWMSKLALTKNNKLLELIHKDYVAIDEPIPIRVVKNAKKEIKQEGNQEEKNENDQNTERIRSKRGRRRKEYTNASEQLSFQNIQNEKTQSSKEINQIQEISLLSQEDQMKLKYASQIKDIMENLNLGLGVFENIIIKDIEIIMDNNQDMSQMDNQSQNNIDQSYQFNDQNSDDLQNNNLGLLGLQISKIKIGRIEFRKDKNKEDDK